MKRLFGSKSPQPSNTPAPLPSFNSLTGNSPPHSSAPIPPSAQRTPLLGPAQGGEREGRQDDSDPAQQYSVVSPVPTPSRGNSGSKEPKKGLFGLRGVKKGGHGEEGAGGMVGGEASAPAARGGDGSNAQAPPRIENVAGVIGWSCAAPMIDYTYVLSLCDHVSLSSTAAKDAARALRKELKYATPVAQERAVRLMGIMMRNTDLRFRQQIASKVFLNQLTEVWMSKKTDPAVVEMINRVLSPLAYDYQRDSELSTITALWNKHRPPTSPINGLPLDPSDELFTPTSDPRRAPTRYTREREYIPTVSEQLNELEKEVVRAKGNAGMLSEAVAFTPPEELEGNELVSEFYADCVASQEIMESNLAWITSQASQSRSRLPPSPSPIPSRTPTPPTSSDLLVDITTTTTSPKLSSNNPFAGLAILPTPTPPHTEATTEEALLEMLLAAHSDLHEALTLHSSATRAHTDSLALLATQQLSLGETKFDRTTAGEMDRDGNYQSPPPPLPTSPFDDSNEIGDIARESKGKGKGKEVVASGSGSTPSTTNGKTLNPYAAYLTPPTPTAEKFADGEEEEELRVRSEPSEKAFGKLRSVSTRTEVDEGEQQTRLEAQLREKYSRNYEEDRGRRSAELERRSPDSSLSSAADRRA